MRPILLSVALVSATAFGAPLDDAIALYRTKRYGAARAALERVVAVHAKARLALAGANRGTNAK